MNRQDKDYILNLYSLLNKRGVVTGASSGLGKAITLMLARAGAEVFALSRSGSFKTAVQDMPQGIYHKKIDITDQASVNRLIKNIGRNGLDFLVNNAGITARQAAADFDQRKWQEIQNINITAAFNMAQCMYPYLKKAKNSGRIVNISSMAAHFGFTEVVPYGVSKAAILGLTRGLSVEWAGDNILVNSISPGWFPSDMLRQVMDQDRKTKILQRMPLHRFGEADELAAMVCFLLSPAATYITGQDIAVDGGAMAYGY